MRVPVTVDDIPDECLASIFQLLPSADRKSCSAVCRRWLKIEAQIHHRLYLAFENRHSIPSIFSRFTSVTELILSDIGHKPLILISQRCPNLASLSIRYSDLTDAALEDLAKNYCKGLKKFSCAHCDFGYKGLNALMHHCGDLNILSVTNYRVITDGVGVASSSSSSSSLKAICLRDSDFFYPILGAKNLTILKLVRCYGNWDKLFYLLVDRVPGLVELHLRELQTSDIALKAISKCSRLEILRLVKNDTCTDAGLVAVLEGCKLLRKLRIEDVRYGDGIGDGVLMAVAECCPNLQELALVGINPSTKGSLEMLASKCESQSIERLALCGFPSTVGNSDIYCILGKLFQSDGFMNIFPPPGGFHAIKGTRFLKKWREGNFFY